MSAKKTVLFVCTGNICRSPMAAGFLYDQLVNSDSSDGIRVRSAGIWALEGQPASAYARQVMGEHDLDISAHRGRNLTQDDLDEAELVLVMTKRHASTILRSFEGCAGRLHLLSEMAGEAQDIEDPYGGSLSQYRHTAAEIADLIDRGFPRILELLQG